MEPGAVYISRYTKKAYIVLIVNEQTGTAAVRWQDGTVSAYGTSLDKIDIKLSAK